MSDGRDALRLVPDGQEASPEGVDASGVVASGESEQALLAAGKISVDEYMEMAVDRTLSHLEGQISDARLSMMRDVLRTDLQNDPNLAALVARVASGD